MDRSQADIHVRPAARHDHATIVAFQCRMAHETENLTLDESAVETGVRTVLDDPARGRYWVADLGGQVIGCLLTLPEWSDWRNGTVLWIHSVYVRPEFRRRGVFRALYRHVAGIVEADDSLKGLRLYVDRRNLAARKTYEALGMDGEHYQLYEWLK